MFEHHRVSGRSRLDERRLAEALRVEKVDPVESQPREQVGADDGADHRDHHVGHRRRHVREVTASDPRHEYAELAAPAEMVAVANLSSTPYRFALPNP